LSLSCFIDGYFAFDATTPRFRLGPGVYILYRGSCDDANIVYIGRSKREIWGRLNDHRRGKDKKFSHVGVIIPKIRSGTRVEDLEHSVLADYYRRFAKYPLHNKRHSARLGRRCDLSTLKR
jgi:hypothetical protein